MPADLAEDGAARDAHSSLFGQVSRHLVYPPLAEHDRWEQVPGEQRASGNSNNPATCADYWRGIGGLCLARGLRKSGISVAVYERDRSARFRGQRYRISLKEDGSHALRDCLPENLFNFSVATSIKSATQLAFWDHQLNQKFAKTVPQTDPDDVRFGVRRLTLREILLAGLEGIVESGRTFERFDQLDDGRVRACFGDAASATGDLLIGADGTDSAVRALIVPDAEIADLHCAIYSKTPITSDTLAWVPEMLVDSFSQIFGPEGVAWE